MSLGAAAFTRASRKALERAGVAALLGGDSNPLVADLLATLAAEVEEYVDDALMTQSSPDALAPRGEADGDEDEGDDALEASFFDFRRSAEDVQRFLIEDSAVAYMLREEAAEAASIEEEDVRELFKFVCEELHKETRSLLERLSRESAEAGSCELCERETRVTRHHLRPRSEHAGLLRRGEFTRDELSAVARLCRPCHNAVHTFIPDNRELAESYYSVPLLLRHEQVFAHARWLSRQSAARRPSVR